MNPFERWDDWEWERAIHEVGKEQGRGTSARPKQNSRNYRNPPKTGWGNLLKHWNGTQKRSVVAAILFLLVFFSANNSDQVSHAVHSLYQGTVNSANFYESLNGMAKDALSIGGVSSKADPVDAKMLGQFLAPLSGQVMAGFGEKGNGTTNPLGTVHNGIDVGSSLGTPVVSPAAGVVTLVGLDPQLGNIVKVDLGDGWTTILGNLGDISVRQGQRVEKGEVLGKVGLSAPLKKPWLHFELRKDNQPLNPIPYLIQPAAKS